MGDDSIVIFNLLAWGDWLITSCFLKFGEFTILEIWEIFGEILVVFMRGPPFLEFVVVIIGHGFMGDEGIAEGWECTMLGQCPL